MEIAKKGFTESIADQRQIILAEQGLVAYDIWLVNHNMVPDSSRVDTVELMTQALSKRLEDMVEGGVLELLTAEIISNPAIFALSSFGGSIITSGGFATLFTHTIPFPKPYRVPFASYILKASSSVAVACSMEVYYEEVKVSAQEMSWLRRRTQVIRTA